MPSPLTAGEIVDRIRKQVGIPWRTQTVDQIVAGDENTPVWLRSFVTEVSIEFIPTKEPFWTPDHPVQI